MYSVSTTTSLKALNDDDITQLLTDSDIQLEQYPPHPTSSNSFDEVNSCSDLLSDTISEKSDDSLLDSESTSYIQSPEIFNFTYNQDDNFVDIVELKKNFKQLGDQIRKSSLIKNIESLEKTVGNVFSSQIPSKKDEYEILKQISDLKTQFNNFEYKFFQISEKTNEAIESTKSIQKKLDRALEENEKLKKELSTKSDEYKKNLEKLEKENSELLYQLKQFEKYDEKVLLFHFF